MSVCKSGGGQMMSPEWEDGYKIGKRDAIRTIRGLNVRDRERNDIVEECARVVEGWSVPWQLIPSITDLAAAIRALKDKGHGR